MLVVITFFNCKNDMEKTDDNGFKLFYNGDIITMHSEKPSYVEAVVEHNGKIVFTGKLKDAEANYANAKKIDLNRKTLLPGFIDAHSHFGMVSNTMGQVDLNPAPIGSITNIDDIIEQLKIFKQEKNIPDGEWIFGWGYDDGQLAEKRHPTKNDIDKALPNNPVYLQHTSSHMGVANTLALDKLKVSSDTKNPEGGNIARFPNSEEPTGLMQETAMYPFMEVMLTEFSSKQAEFFETTQRYYASNGITTAHDGMADRNAIRFYQSQADSGKFYLDLVALAGSFELDSNLKDETLQFKTYKNRFKVQGTKVVADGSPQGKTAYFTKPYLTEVSGCITDCRGLPSIAQADLNAMFVTAYEAKNQLFVHCNGDATIDMVLEAHEKACLRLNIPLDTDFRTIIIHAQFARADQLFKFVKYKMEPSFFSNHAYFWGDDHVRNLGQKRADFLSPMVSADRLGLKITNHSDAPITPVNPIFSIWSAVNRVSRSGAVIGEKERAKPYVALKAVTSNAAYQFFEHHLKGSISVGKLADFVILDANPLKVKPMDIKNIQVLETIKEGQTIFKK